MPDTPVSEKWKITDLPSWADLEKKLCQPIKCIGVAGPPGTGKTDLIAEACKGSLKSEKKGSGVAAPPGTGKTDPAVEAGKGNLDSDKDPDKCSGVAELPGAGKTDPAAETGKGNLIPDRDLMPGFVMRAPVNADHSEIARLLVLNLCSLVSGEEAGSRMRSIAAGHAGMGALISSVAAVIVGSVLLGLSAAGIRISAQVDLATVVLLAGVAGLLAWFIPYVGRYWGWFAFRRSAGGTFGDDVKFSPKLRKHAVILADRLEAERRFETTVTSGWSGQLTVSGVQIGPSGSVSKKHLPMPLDELARHYQDLASKVAGKKCLLIGIDGLDKRGPGADIDQILYDLRAFLNAEGCRYLIAMAEDSESRTYFRPGIMGGIVRCELLTFKDARGFIEEHIEDVPKAVVALCFTASAALVGKMVKMTNFVRESEDRSDLESICRDIVNNELMTLCAELRSTARALPSWERQRQLFNWAKQLSGGPPEADSLRSVADNIRSVADDKADVANDNDPRLPFITHRAAALAYFYATLIDFFKKSLSPEALDSAIENEQAKSLSRLAAARRLIDLAICGPAWNDIKDFRDAWKIPVTSTANESGNPKPQPDQG
jgi:hypothetical protein